MNERRIVGAHAGPIPARAGIGLRAGHFDALVAAPPPVGWLEVHPENHFSAGGRPLAVLEAVRRDYPLSFHGVSLDLGGTDPLDQDDLDRLAALVSRFQPGLVSEHLAWSRHQGRYFNDLLPLPYTEEALNNITARVQRVQERLGRQILIENPSTYVRFADADYDEPAFLTELCRRSGCGLLADINNLYVNACNHGGDAGAALRALPADAVGEIHLAGHSRRRTAAGELLIDTHDAPVSPAVWALFAEALALWGPRPTLIEWDQDLPELPALTAEAARADELLARHHALAS
jgi:uncharacterized protein (UPF0276 family)